MAKRQVLLTTAMAIVEEAAELDGSFGWTLSLGIGAGRVRQLSQPSAL